MKKGFMKKAVSFLALMVALIMVTAVLPVNFTVVSAAEDYYDNIVHEYKYGSDNYGYYFTPKKPGKYPTVIIVHGQGGVTSMKRHMPTFMNDWVKAGIFPPMNVVLPAIDHPNGAQRDAIHFQEFVRLDSGLKTLLDNIKSGAMSPKIDTDAPIWIGGYSMGGMTSINACSKFHELKVIGCLSPSASFYLGENKGGVYNYAADIHMPSDAKILMICGAGEADSATYNGYQETIDRYYDAIKVNANEDIMYKAQCPSEWGGHAWRLFQKEIFAWLYLGYYGEVPTVAQMNAACEYRQPDAPEIVKEEVDYSDIELPEKLIDLDLSTYQKDTTTNPASTNASIGGITNAGTRGDATRIVMSSNNSGGSQSIDLETLDRGTGREVPYLHYTKDTSLLQENNKTRFIEDNILETQANTITFWANVTTQTERRAILNYAVKNEGDTQFINKLRLNTDSSTTKLYLCNGWDGDARKELVGLNGKWAQYTIVNPAYDDSGNKTISVYVDGIFQFSRQVSKGEGEVSQARLFFAGEGEGNHSICYPDDISYGDIAVYGDALDAVQIKKIYEESREYFEEPEIIIPEDPEESTEAIPDDEKAVPYDGDILIDLDPVTYVKDNTTNPDTATGSIGNITNNGTRKDITRVVMSNLTSWNNQQLSKRIFKNAEGTRTSYLKFTKDTDSLDQDNNRRRFIEDNIIEEADNTISFWTKLSPMNERRGILNIYATYGGAGTNILRLCTQTGTPLKLGNGWDSDVNVNIDETSGQWAYYTVVNPAYKDGSKTIKVYVNGALKFTRTVAQPSGTLSSARMYLAGEASGGHAICIPDEICYGDFKVFDSAMSDSDIAAMYEATKYRFTRDGSVLPGPTDPDPIPEPVEDEVLIDLDLTDFAPSNEAGSSGIVNKGTMQTAEISAYSTKDLSVTTDYIYDKNDLSKYKKVIRAYHNDLAAITSGKQFPNILKITDPAFENQAITLSFWTNIDPISKQTSAHCQNAVAQYNVKRDDGTYRNASDGTSSRARLWQYNIETGQYYYWGSAWGYEITVDKSKQWHHVVMSIPKTENGAKTVSIYVDGALGITQNVNLGGHSAQTAAFTFGGDENGGYIPGDISFSDIKVYAGAMTESSVKNLYNSEKGDYEDLALNTITVKNGDNVITGLENLEAGSQITVNSDENTNESVFVFAAVVDENNRLLKANAATVEGSGSFDLTIPENFAKLNVYTWNTSKLEPIQKVKELYK